MRHRAAAGSRRRVSRHAALRLAPAAFRPDQISAHLLLLLVLLGLDPRVDVVTPPAVRDRDRDRVQSVGEPGLVQDQRLQHATTNHGHHPAASAAVAAAAARFEAAAAPSTAPHTHFCCLACCCSACVLSRSCQAWAFLALSLASCGEQGVSSSTMRGATKQLQTKAHRKQRQQHVQRSMHSGRMAGQRQQLHCMDTGVSGSKSSSYPRQLPSPPLLSLQPTFFRLLFSRRGSSSTLSPLARCSAAPHASLAS